MHPCFVLDYHLQNPEFEHCKAVHALDYEVTVIQAKSHTLHLCFLNTLEEPLETQQG